jgi:hypothetical protein
VELTGQFHCTLAARAQRVKARVLRARGASRAAPTL